MRFGVFVMKKPLLSELTLREKIGQTALGRARNQDLLDLKKHPYGFIWSLGNIEMGVINMDDKKADVEITNRKKWNQFLKDMWKEIRVPVMAAMDSTNGIMNSFSEFPMIMDPVTMGATDSDELAYEAGVLRAEHLKFVGTNWLWSPEVDLPNRLSTICLGRRYSDDPERLTRMAIADMKGIQSKRCAATAKHFPGADPFEYRDAHTALNVNILTKADWQATQGKTFKDMFDAGVDSVMISHTSFPSIDNSKINGTYRPASVSYKIITELLKEEMGFKGVVITDGITMKGLLSLFHGDLNRVYVEAIKAGNDVVLACGDGYFDAIEEAVLSGEIPMSRIDDACQRVLDMKERYGLFDDDYVISNDSDEELADCIRRTNEFNKKVAERAVSLVCDNNSLFPLKAEKIKNVAVIYSGRSDEAYENLSFMKEAFAKRGANLTFQRGLKDHILPDEIIEIAKENDLIIYAGHILRTGGFPTFYGDELNVFHQALVAGAEKSVGLGLGSPFMYYDFYAAFPAFINAYNPSEFTMEAVVAAMYGEIEFSKIHPYAIYPPEITDYLKKNNIEL
ncbi:MAG: hypothetical protein E7561_03660 [Ruminococcaceae bacterium]|nr:hypothetical protein [Oscillospiraceae bacterium]